MADTRTRNPKTALISLITAQYLSSFGNSITVVTIPIYVLSVSDSALATGLAGFASTLPLIFAGAIGGVWIDRLGGRRMSILCDFLAGACIAAVPLLDGAVGGLPLPVLMGLLFARSIVATPAYPSRLSMLKTLSDQAGTRLDSVNSWFQAAPRLGLVIGAPVAAVIAGLSPVLGLYVDAATFLLAALIVLVGLPKNRPEKPAERPNAFRQLVEGAALVRTIPVVGAMTAFVFITNLLDDAFAPVILPVYADDVLHNSRYLGWFLAATGVGAVAGTFLYAPVTRRFLAHRRMTLLGCFVVIGVLRLLMVAGPNVWVMTFIALLLGLAAGPLNPVLSAVMMEWVPEKAQGRVFALTGSVAMSAAPLGILVAGWGITAVGLRTVLAVFGAAYLVLVLISLRTRALHDMDAPAPAEKTGASRVG